jgi:hypothetical protein
LEGAGSHRKNGCLHPLSVTGRNGICSSWAVLIIVLKINRLHEMHGTEMAKLFMEFGFLGLYLK